MSDYFVTLKIQANNLKEADQIASGLSDTMECPIAGVYPGHHPVVDSEGQVIVYTDYYHPTHGA